MNSSHLAAYAAIIVSFALFIAEAALDVGGPWLWVGAVAFFLLGLTLFWRSTRGGTDGDVDATPSPSRTVDVTENRGVAQTGDKFVTDDRSVAQSGRGSIAQTGDKSVLVIGGDYHEAVSHVEKGRRVVDASPRDLHAIYTGDYTSVQADQIFNLFKDKWMRVEGRVHDVVGQEGGAWAVFIDRRDIGDFALALFFHETRRVELMVL